jgi:hypothetical protein
MIIRTFPTRLAVVAAALIATTMFASNAVAAVAGPRTFLDFQPDPPTSPAETPAGWNFYTLNDSLNDRQIPLNNEFGQWEGMRFRFFHPDPSRSTSFGNTPMRTQVAPSGIDLTGFGYSASMQTVGDRLELTGLVPNLPYDFWLITWTYPGAPYPAPALLSVSGAAGWTQLQTPAGALLAINGSPTDTSHTFDSYAKRFTAAADGSFTIEAVQAGYIGVYGFLIQPIPEPGSVLGSAVTLLCTFVCRRRRH